MNPALVELSRRGFPGLHEWVRVGEIPSLLVGLRDVVLKRVLLDPPLPSTADLDRGEFFASYESVDLRTGDVEHFGNICKGQETLFGGHIHNFATECMSFRSFNASSVDLEG